MKLLADHAKRLAALESKVDTLVQEAIIVAVYPEEATVDIEVRGVMLSKVPYMTFRSGAIGKTWWAPEVGESGLLQCPGGNVGNAVFMPSINTTDNPAPSADPDAIVVEAPGQNMLFDMGDEIEIVLAQDETQLKRAKDLIKIDDDEIVVDRSGNLIKIDADETEVKRGSNIIKVDGSETVVGRGGNSIKIDGSVIELKRGTGNIKLTLGTNLIDLSAIVASIVGAHFFPTGLTNLITPVGNAFFAPAPPPASAPPPPAASSPSEGKATKTPPSTVDGVTVTKGTISFTIPALVVTGTAGTVPVTGTTVALPVTIPFTATGVTLVFPSKSLK